jgi:hypothetical protein
MGLVGVDTRQITILGFDQLTKKVEFGGSYSGARRRAEVVGK